METTIIKKITFIYDDMEFVVSLQNMNNPKYDYVGYHIDRLGYLQQIKKESTYGELVTRVLANNDIGMVNQTPDSLRGKDWWNGMSAWQRKDALKFAELAGYKNPSPADAWANLKQQKGIKCNKQD